MYQFLKYILIRIPIIVGTWKHWKLNFRQSKSWFPWCRTTYNIFMNSWASSWLKYSRRDSQRDIKLKYVHSKFVLCCSCWMRSSSLFEIDGSWFSSNSIYDCTLSNRSYKSDNLFLRSVMSCRESCVTSKFSSAFLWQISDDLMVFRLVLPSDNDIDSMVLVKQRIKNRFVKYACYNGTRKVKSNMAIDQRKRQRCYMLIKNYRFHTLRRCYSEKFSKNHSGLCVGYLPCGTVW